MLWRHALTMVVLVGAAGSSPVAAQVAAPIGQAAAPADSTWPTIVPRLASYTVAQKAAITDTVQQYCTEHQVAKRAELQTKIQKLLTQEQIIEAIRYWLPQNVRHDFHRPGQSVELDACDRPVEVS